MTDRVFGGMTRPATVGGVPQGVFGVLLIATILMVLTPVLLRFSFIWSIAGILFGVLGFMTCRIICERDPNTFEYVKVNFRFWLKARGRKVGKGLVTFSKAPIRKR